MKERSETILDKIIKLVELLFLEKNRYTLVFLENGANLIFLILILWKTPGPTDPLKRYNILLL